MSRSEAGPRRRTYATASRGSSGPRLGRQHDVEVAVEDVPAHRWLASAEADHGGAILRRRAPAHRLAAQELRSRRSRRCADRDASASARRGKDGPRAGGGGHVLRRSLRSLRSVIRRQDPPATGCGPTERHRAKAAAAVAGRRPAGSGRSVQRHGPVPDDRGPGGRVVAAVGRAGACVRGAWRPGALSLRPLPGARGRSPRARRARRMDDARGARRRDDDAAPGDARLACDLPPPVGAGQGRRDRRSRLERPGGARARRRLARARARGLRVPLPVDARADGRPRGAAAGDPGLVVGRALRLRRRALPPERPRRPTEAGAAPAPADHHRRQRRTAQRRARRALRRRVQHRVRHAGRGARAPGGRRARVRGRRPSSRSRSRS